MRLARLHHRVLRQSLGIRRHLQDADLLPQSIASTETLSSWSKPRSRRWMWKAAYQTE